MSSSHVPDTVSGDLSNEDLLAWREGRTPDIEGRSKKLWLLSDGLCLIEIIPSLRSFTFDRDEIVTATGPLRLDFYERAAARLAKDGVRTAFSRRVSPTCYLAEYCPAPPFEVVVKNRAVGSTLVKYPGLFEPEQVLPAPVVKFDYRTDPEDQPIAESYLRALDLPVEELARLALAVNDTLAAWLSPVEVWDFCLIFGFTPDREPVLISEVSQDCMRLRHPDGSSLDKDLFRRGASHEEIAAAWRKLLDELA
ncbi:phosphoribosylaminoimidazolesuccinocarboxamide synthase [Streptomyces sp. WM4235]|uniref:phosphoribosylaminoimidazolesuccinocarboxamide synthase n=1 Tax=Streptomyces sp. WM4235 TaxID=1415551 RepID=UPI000A413D1F|nr:phosphoribosylaminoimidazolesuccinocarboxamide synthase [Streptomyces sp. WM4235]